MTNIQIDHQEGFTLIEMVIVIVLLAIITATSSQILSQGINAYITNKNINEADWQARYALSRMALDIRQINGVANISAASNSQLTFVNNAGTTIMYTKSSTNFFRQGIVLASGVNTMTLSYYTSAGSTTSVISAIGYIGATLNITLNNSNITETTRVALRNL